MGLQICTLDMYTEVGLLAYGSPICFRNLHTVFYSGRANSCTSIFYLGLKLGVAGGRELQSWKNDSEKMLFVSDVQKIKY